MIVICKKPTKRLVKGAKYEVQNLWNDGTNQRWLESTISIKGIGRFAASNFTDENGNQLPKINLAMPVTTAIRPNFEDLKQGDILVCLSGNYKSLVEGGMYQIESLISRTYTPHNWVNYQRKEQKVKFVGVKRPLSFNSWRFRCLTTEEVRDMSLNQILHNQELPVIKEAPKKKIDLVPNKEEFLAKIIFQSIVDPKRHAISIPEWACQKVAPKMDLVPEDFDELLPLTLQEIIEKMECKKTT